jgi:hypothetical protein
VAFSNVPPFVGRDRRRPEVAVAELVSMPAATARERIIAWRASAAAVCGATTDGTEQRLIDVQTHAIEMR